jgi:hypothetical protein
VFFWQFQTLATSHTRTETFILSSLAFLHIGNFYSKPSKSPSCSCFFHHLDNFVKHCESSIIICTAPSLFCFQRAWQWWKEIWGVPSILELISFKDPSLPSIIFFCFSLYHSKRHCFIEFSKTSKFFDHPFSPNHVVFLVECSLLSPLLFISC